LILLDTNALIALALGWPIRPPAQTLIDGAVGQLAVSAVSAWEIGLLATRTGRTRLLFPQNAQRWYADTIAAMGLRDLPLDGRVATEAAYLPGRFHYDPSDRFIVATARLTDATLLTSDRKILDYASLGHVRALAC
jgi:PIN domain nuclease of toxin-antitoxin system